MKYIRYSGGSFVIFPDTINHNDIRVRGQFIGEPCNAGKVQIYTRDREVQVHTYGESTSLKLKASKEDGEAIKKMFENY
jgi:hypothetical protein